MTKQAIIFEVSDRSFEKYVIGNSNKTPVFVTFLNTATILRVHLKVTTDKI